MVFADEPGGIAGFAKNVPDIHVVAFECDVEIGKPLFVFAADLIDVAFAVRVSGEAAGQKTVPRRSAHRTADVGASELHPFVGHAIEIGRVGVASERGDAGWILIVDQKHDDVRTIGVCGRGDRRRQAED